MPGQSDYDNSGGCRRMQTLNPDSTIYYAMLCDEVFLIFFALMHSYVITSYPDLSVLYFYSIRHTSFINKLFVCLKLS